MPTPSPLCTIVVPCYNEALRFPVDRFRRFAFSHPSLHFVLVNDGSKDDTLQLLHTVRQGLESQFRVIDQKANQGKAEAVRVGILAALEDAAAYSVGFWDADLATPLEAIPDLARILEDQPAIQMVFGSRVKLLGRHVERNPLRHYLGRVFATIVSNLLRLPIYDTQCGAKLFRAHAQTAALFSQPFHSRWVFDVEIIARFLIQQNRNLDSVKASIYEFPLLEWRDIAGSKVRPQDFLKAFLDVFRIYRIYLA